MHERIFIALLLFLLAFAPAKAQPRLVLVRTDSSVTDRQFEKLVGYQSGRKPVLAENELRSILFRLHEKGYLLASVDSLQKDSAQVTAYLQTGMPYTWVQLKKGGADKELLTRAGFRERSFRKGRISPRQLAQAEEKIIAYCEDNGYPFASIRLDSVEIAGQEVRAQLKLDKNMAVKIDSLVIKGGAGISKKYISNYIGIREKDPYRESYVAAISDRTRELPFVKEIKPPTVLFTEKYSKLILYLDNKKANQFDGILGFLPDDKTGKLLITGQAHLQLLNSFAHGELIDIDWRKLQPLSQDLKTAFNYPFLLNSPFGVDLRFRLYKKDTTFTEVTQQGGIQYLLRGGNYLKIFVGNRTTSLISTKGFENIIALPPYADVKVISYGLGLKNSHLDYLINPRKGYKLQVTGSAGNKNILKNPKINPAAYNGLELRSVQYNFEVDAVTFLPLFKRSALALGIKSAALLGNNTFENELLRFGGLNTLRGFDEESFRASGYGIANMEYRFLFEKNSNLFLFANGCYYEKNTVKGHSSDTPFGFGTGINFQTKAGIFTLTYALGKQLNNPILLRSAKIHFGIISVF